MFDFDAFDHALANSGKFNFDAFEDVFAAQNGPAQRQQKSPFNVDKASEDIKGARDLELYISSRLQWTITHPQNWVLGANLKVRSVKANSALEQHVADAVTTLARRLDSLCKKLCSTFLCKAKFYSVCMLLEHIMHGIFEEGHPVQYWCQSVFDCLSAFVGALSSVEARGGALNDSQEVIDESWASAFVQILPLLKNLLECCMFEMASEKECAWSLYHALNGPLRSELVKEWLTRNETFSCWIRRMTCLTATRLLFDLRRLISAPDFQREYHTLRSSSSAQANHEASKMVLEIYGCLLPMYGFDVSAKGVHIMRNECSSYAECGDTCVHKLRSDVHYLLETGARYNHLVNPYTHITLQQYFKKLPLVTVVIPTHSGRGAGRLHLLRSAVLSAVTQTYGNVEIVIAVQNILNSEDDMYFQIVTTEFSNQAGVTVVCASETREAPEWWEESRCQNRAAFVRNAALKDVRGDFIAFLDDDDVWLRWKLAEQLSAMFKAKSEFSATEAYGGDLRDLRPWSPFLWQQGESPPHGLSLYNRQINRELLKLLVPDYSPEDSYISIDALSKHNVIVTSTVVMSCALLKRVGLMSETAKNEDHDFWRRAAEIAGPILSVPEALSVYDCAHGAISLKRSDESEELQVIFCHRPSLLQRPLHLPRPQQLHPGIWQK